jgi:(1->4)-alpha-D-glucan 1-alpha-D-glucosylmutase
MAVSSFHGVMRERHASWPHTLSATSTHDTKRSEDVRARINVLSEMPGAWRSRVRLWSRLNKKYRAVLDGQPAPDRNEEYLLYQTLIGTWPLEPLDDEAYRVFCDRIESYMEKALHEAKLHTSWLNPNHHYTGAVRKFIEAILDRTRPNPFLQDMATLIQDVIVPVGLSNALAQTLIKIIAPGIPDFYQGTELWDFSLVDPDNRRPVDYARRMQVITELQEACRQAANDRRVLARQLRETSRDGRIKLYVIMTGLNLRRAHASLFLHGTYLPLDCHGDKKHHLCAFARLHEQQAVITVAPRLLVGLGTERGPEVWRNTMMVLPPELSASSYRNLFTGEVLTPTVIVGERSLCLADVFQDFPLGLLESIP